MATVGIKSEVNTEHRQTYNYDIVDSSARSVNSGLSTGSTGGNAAHNVLQPSICVYGWRRSA